MYGYTDGFLHTDIYYMIYVYVYSVIISYIKFKCNMKQLVVHATGQRKIVCYV